MNFELESWIEKTLLRDCIRFVKKGKAPSWVRKVDSSTSFVRLLDLRKEEKKEQLDKQIKFCPSNATHEVWAIKKDQLMKNADEFDAYVKSSVVPSVAHFASIAAAIRRKYKRMFSTNMRSFQIHAEEAEEKTIRAIGADKSTKRVQKAYKKAVQKIITHEKRKMLGLMKRALSKDIRALKAKHEKDLGLILKVLKTRFPNHFHVSSTLPSSFEAYADAAASSTNAAVIVACAAPLKHASESQDVHNQ